MDWSILIDLAQVLLAALVVWLTRKVPSIDKIVHSSCRPCPDCNICPKNNTAISGSDELHL